MYLKKHIYNHLILVVVSDNHLHIIAEVKKITDVW